MKNDSELRNGTLHSILRRYSCRDFTDRMPSDEDLKLIAQAAVAAPSAVNRQPWRVFVVKNKALISDMEQEGMRLLASWNPKGYDRMMARGGHLYYHAPCMMLVAIHRGQPEGLEWCDCGILAQNISLSATSMGIDNLICGFAAVCFRGPRGDEFRERLGFPAGYEMGLAVLLGYAPASAQGEPHEPDLGKISFID